MAQEVWLNWQALGDDDNDPRWSWNRCLYAYLPPRRSDVFYIGKCDGTTVRQRWSYANKSGTWDYISQFCQSHRIIVAPLALPEGSRFSSQLLTDIESLLIFTLEPSANVQATRSRTCRPGLVVRCEGEWPLSTRTFRDFL
jgi:hypothetical protein